MEKRIEELKNRLAELEAIMNQPEAPIKEGEDIWEHFNAMSAPVLERLEVLEELKKLGVEI